MQAHIIAIGNSKGLRIPKPLLMESGLGPNVDITAKKGQITIRQAPNKEDVDMAAASEASFAKDWLRPEEEDAWAIYQPDK